MDAILGAPQRFLSGMANAGGHEALDIQHPAHAAQEIRDWAAHGYDVATHPFDDRIQDQNINATLHTLGVDRLLDHVDKYVTASAQPEWLKTYETAGARLGAIVGSQLVTDPTGVLPVLRMAGMGAHVARAASAAQKGVNAVLGSKAAAPIFTRVQKAAQTVGVSQLVQQVKNVTSRRPELDEFLTPDAKARRLSIESRTSHTYAQPQRDEDTKALEKHAAVLGTPQGSTQAGFLQTEPGQQYLQQAYVHGTGQMRMEAEHQFGYKPRPGEAQKAPTGHLDYDIQEDLNEVLSGNHKGPKGGLAAIQKKFNPNTAKQTNIIRPAGPSLGNPLADTLAKRLALGRHTVTEAITNRDTKLDLMRNGGWKGPTVMQPGLKPGQSKQIPINVAENLTHGPPELQPTAATWLGKLGTSSVMGNPFPHGLKNVGDLTYMAGGAHTYGKGLAYASAGVPQKMLDRMAMAGIERPDYLRDISGPLSVAVKPGQQLLNRLEIGWRAALLDHYDRVAPLANDLVKADWIRRDVGDYRNVSAFVRGLQAIGGPFVAFRIGTVPAAVGRAALRNPQRVENIARPDIDVNTDDGLMGRSPSEAVSGGPVQDAAELGFNTKGFFESPSTAGPIGEAARQSDEMTQGWGESLTGALSNIAQQYIPYGAAARTGLQLYGATGGPGADKARGVADAVYGQPPGVSALSEALYSLYGGYFKQRPSDRNRNRTINRMMNAQ
jgi:hypothetical protein